MPKRRQTFESFESNAKKRSIDTNSTEPINEGVMEKILRVPNTLLSLGFHFLRLPNTLLNSFKIPIFGGALKPIDHESKQAMKAKIEELSKLLKSKDIEIENFNSEIKDLKSELDFYKEIRKNNHQIQCDECFELCPNDDPPSDQLSLWINNPGLKHLTKKILSFLDVKSLGNCKNLSKTMYNYIHHQDDFVYLKIMEFKFYPQDFTDPTTQIKFTESNFEGSAIKPELAPDGEAKFVEQWEMLIDLIQYEKIHIQWNFYNKIEEIGWFYNDSRFVCLDIEAVQTLEKILDAYPVQNEDIPLPDRSLEEILVVAKFAHPVEISSEKLQRNVLNKALKFKLLMNSTPRQIPVVLKHFLKQKIKFNAKEILFEMYSQFIDFGNISNLEMVFKHSHDLGIELDVENDHGKTLLDVATQNEDIAIIYLYKKYGKMN